jgi:hypothetical protein
MFILTCIIMKVIPIIAIQININLKVMKQKCILFLFLSIPLFCLAQNPLPREFDYDAAGNRILRKVITMPLPAPPAPAAPIDSLLAAQDSEHEERNTENEVYDEFQSSTLTPSLPHSITPFFVEKIAGMEMKIFPNPTTEKITFEMSGMVDSHDRAYLRLYSLSGQLLQTQTIRSATTEISLVGLAKGVYILKVQMEGVTEEWKVIKN